MLRAVLRGPAIRVRQPMRRQKVPCAGFPSRCAWSLRIPDRCHPLLYPGPLSTSFVRKWNLRVRNSSGEREQNFLMTRGLAPELAARLCLDRLLRNPARIVIRQDYRIIDLLIHFFATRRRQGHAVDVEAAWVLSRQFERRSKSR